MAGFRPVGSFPVASVPAGVAGTVYSITTNSILFSGNPFGFTYTFPQTRVSWIGSEVLHTGTPTAVITWMGVEVLRSIADAGGDSAFVSIIW